MLVHQRTQCVNALRGHLSEYGYVFPQLDFIELRGIGECVCCAIP